MKTALYAVLVLWALWLASWLLARDWTKTTVARPQAGAETLYTVIVNIGAALMLAPVFNALGPRLWSLPPWLAWALVGVAVFGWGFCWWARLHLGRNWSWSVTLKEGHAIIDSGPYRFVRHPIYTGLLIAGAATVALEAKALAIVGFAMMIAGFWIKARLEERFLRSELGEAAYDGYAARTGMLLPWIS